MSNYYDTAVYCNKFPKNNKKQKNYKLQLEVSMKHLTNM